MCDDKEFCSKLSFAISHKFHCYPDIKEVCKENPFDKEIWEGKNKPSELERCFQKMKNISEIKINNVANDNVK